MQRATDFSLEILVFLSFLKSFQMTFFVRWPCNIYQKTFLFNLVYYCYFTFSTAYNMKYILKSPRGFFHWQAVYNTFWSTLAVLSMHTYLIALFPNDNAFFSGFLGVTILQCSNIVYFFARHYQTFKTSYLKRYSCRSSPFRDFQFSC